MKKLIKNILVHADLTENSLNAINTAIKMSRRHQAVLHLLYVLDIKNLYPAERMLGPMAVYTGESFKRDTVILEGMTKAISQKHNIQCICYNEQGFLSSTICDKAAKLNCDLIIMATGENEYGSNYLIDSLPYRVLQKSSCALLTVPVKRRFDYFRNILFPVRVSSALDDKYLWTEAIARHNQSNIFIIGLLEQKEPAHFRKIRTSLANTRQWMNRARLPHRSDVRSESNLIQNILEAGRSDQSDLIVFNASTERSLKEFFLGSYTQKMIRNQEFAVLYLKSKDYLNRSKIMKLQPASS